MGVRRPGPRGAPRRAPDLTLARPTELERIPPRRAVLGVLEREQPPDLTPGQEHRQPEMRLVRPQVVAGPRLHRDDADRCRGLRLDGIGPLGALDRDQLPVPDPPNGRVHQHRLARRLPRLPEVPPLRAVLRRLNRPALLVPEPQAAPSSPNDTSDPRPRI